jgi:hypothetical protein
MRNPSLNDAVAAGIISQEKANELKLFLKDGAQEPIREADEENFRLVTSFNDIFVTIGIGLLFGAIFVLTMQDAPSGGTSLLSAALAWGLSEYFTRKRLMALPSIVLLLIFAAATAFGIGRLALSFMNSWNFSGYSEVRVGLVWAFSALATTLLIYLHWRRFLVPITVAAGVSTFVTCLISLLYAAFPALLSDHLSKLVFGSGLMVFAFAMRFDRSDLSRITRRSDIAFWLHLLAAPMIVHPVAQSIMENNKLLTHQQSISLLIVLGILALVALLVDRRALLVSGLSYGGIALWALIKQSGVITSTLPFTLLVLGAFVLLLSAGWTPLRSFLLRFLPRVVTQNLAPPAARNVA